jgi:hypothetical protein
MIVRSILSALICFLWIASNIRAGDDFESPPISYYDSLSHDPVADLWKKMQSGDVVLKPDEKGTYVRSLLAALDVPISSQCFVFSKTSLQINHINPRKPRAIYFNDHVYVGYVQDSNIMELTAIDPQLGCVFYTLEIPSEGKEDAPSAPTIIRDRGQCLSCHATTRTERVPGVLVRSIYPDKAGRARSGSSSYVTDHRSPFIQRWGGWYVTGEHGSMRHLGNIFAVDKADPQRVDVEEGANLDEIPHSVDAKPYLLATSDIVSLMVMEHQTRLHNLITRANYETRQATHLDAAMNVALGRDSSYVSDSTQRRIASVGDELIRGLLFAEEFELTNPVGSSSQFRDEFSKRGPHDSKGRSLYQLDLNKYLFKYRCSYLILSPHFDGLPAPVMEHVRKNMKAILLGERELPQGVDLERHQKESIRDILAELKPGWLDGK